MGEHLPNSPERKSDEELIAEAIQDATDNGVEISDAAARVIASQMHGGQWSALYSLASTGAIDYERLSDEIRPFFGDDEVTQKHAAFLDSYVFERAMTNRIEPVEGWNKLWLGEKPSLIDKAQKLYDQEVPYQRFVEEFTKEELIELWETHCKGNPEAGFDDEVYDALLIAHGYFFKGGGA